MRRQPTITRTWRVSLNPRAHYNLSCGKDNRFSWCRQLHPDDVVSVVVVVVIGVALRWDSRPRKAMPRQLPPPNFPHVYVASPCDSPAYTRLWYRYTCVGTPGYTCAPAWSGRGGSVGVAATCTCALQGRPKAKIVHEQSRKVKSNVWCRIYYIVFSVTI